MRSFFKSKIPLLLVGAMLLTGLPQVGSASETKTEVTLETNKSSYKPGEEIQVKLAVKDLPKSSGAGLEGFTLAMKYDPAVFDIAPYSAFNAGNGVIQYLPAGYTKGSALSDPSLFDFSNPVDFDAGNGLRELRFLVFDNTGGGNNTPYADFDIATVKMKVKADATLGATVLSYDESYTTLLDSATHANVEMKNVIHNSTSPTIATVSSAKQITAYGGFPEVVRSVIDEDQKVIHLLARFGATLSGKVATFTVSPLATVSVNGTPQISGTTPNNFISDFSLVVTAEDLSTVTYTVKTKIDANRETLIGTILSSNLTKASSVIGAEVGNFTQASVDAFTAAISTATAVSLDLDANQSQVNAASATLAIAATAFDNSIITANKSNLNTSIATAQGVHDAAVVGTTAGNYKRIDKDALNVAINAAQSVVAMKLASQSAVDAATIAMDTAVTNFQSKVLVVPVESVLSSLSLTLNHNEHIIKNLVQNTNASDFLAKFSIEDGGTFNLVKSDGVTPITGTTKVGTGSKIKVDDATGTRYYDIILYGDVNGDGVINATDIIFIKRHLLGASLLTGPYLTAGNAKRGSAILSASDGIFIKGSILGYRIINQN